MSQQNTITRFETRTNEQIKDKDNYVHVQPWKPTHHAVWDGATGRIAASQWANWTIHRIFPFGWDEWCKNCSNNVNRRVGFAMGWKWCRELSYRCLSFDGDGGIDEDVFLNSVPDNWLCPKYEKNKDITL